MIPEAADGATAEISKPRASGDDPHWRAHVRTAADVNPARAGMIRSYCRSERGDVRKPRASGDDPYGLIPDKINTE